MSPPGLMTMPAHSVARRVDRVDQHALVVALHGRHLEAARGRRRGDERFDVLQSLRSVDRGLADAEQVEIRAVDEQEPAGGSHHRTISAALGGVRPGSGSGRAMTISGPIGPVSVSPVGSNPARR